MRSRIAPRCLCVSCALYRAHSDGAKAESVDDLGVVFAALAELLHGQLLVVVDVHARENAVSLLSRALAALFRQCRSL